MVRELREHDMDQVMREVRDAVRYWEEHPEEAEALVRISARREEELRQTHEQLRQTHEQLRQTHEQLRQTHEQLRQTHEQLARREEGLRALEAHLAALQTGLGWAALQRFRRLKARLLPPGSALERAYARLARVAARRFGDRRPAGQA